MADTYNFDQTSFQPILNKMMEQHESLNPDAVILLGNPIPARYQGLKDLGVTIPTWALRRPRSVRFCPKVRKP
jgi:hypothetical protein